METKKEQDIGNRSTMNAAAKTGSEGGNQEGPNTEAPSGAMRGRPPRGELTPQQLRGIHALLTQPTMAAAAQEIGVHPRTVSRWLKERTFRAAYLGHMTELQLDLWRRMLAVRSEVWDRCLQLMRSPDEKVALRAATWFLDRMLSVPAFLSHVSLEEDGFDPGISPSLRTLLEETEVVEHGNKDDAA